MSNRPKALQSKDLRRFDLTKNWARMTGDILSSLYKHKALHSSFGFAINSNSRSLERYLRPELFDSYKHLPHKDLR